MIRWPRLSIRATVLLAIALAVLAPPLLLWRLEQALTRRAHEPLIAQNRQAVLVMTGAALVEPMWTVDERRVRETAARALDDPSVMSLRLTERRPMLPPVELVRPGATLGEGVPLTLPILREGQALGQLELWFDAGQIERLIAGRRWALLQLAALQVLLGVLLLLAVLYRRLLAPIQRLKRQASEIASRSHVKTVRWHAHDELGQLGQHLNRVHEQIDELFMQLEQRKAELERIAMHDPLTGLPNRVLFRELTQAAIAAARRDDSRLALLFIDLDRFKVVNDTVGHPAGDELLVTLADRLRHAVRTADVVCRHSGDEFIVLLRDASQLEEVAATADRVLSEIATPVIVDGREAVVSASVGIALFPDDANDHEELVRHADTAMYVAKRLGGGRHSFYRAEFNARLLATLQLAKELQRALQNSEFVLHYQPQVAAGSGALLGCEALLRWQHPTRGLLPPQAFIEAAEQCGLIGELGCLAIRAACLQAARWKASGVPFISVAIKVSAPEFNHHRLLDTLSQAMAESGVQPHELEIELSERVLMSEVETTRRNVERLQALGLRLAVDDFGTGVSSLSYLRRLRPSTIKIDRSVVHDLPDAADDRVLVLAIVQLAKALGMRAVADGVDSQAQREFLQRCGCDVLQGDLIHRPQPAEDFERFVRGLSGQGATAVPQR